MFFSYWKRTETQGLSGEKGCPCFETEWPNTGPLELEHFSRSATFAIPRPRVLRPSVHLHRGGYLLFQVVHKAN